MSSQEAYERLGAKKLSLVDVVAQSVGFMGPVFSAAFLIPLIAGLNATGNGAGLATPFAVILAAVGTFAMGWIVAEYAKRIHAAGSLYDYVTNGLGPRVGALAGWLYYGATTVLASAIAVLIGGLIHDTLAGEFGFTAIPYWGWNLAFVALVAYVMWAGVQISTRVQLALSLVSAAVVLFFFVDVILNAPSQDLSVFTPAASDQGWGGILFGVLYGVLIFVGFETAANLAEETAEPKRSIPRAILASVVIVSAFYLIAAYAQVAGFGFDLGTLLGEASAAPLFALGSPAEVGGYGSTTILRLLELVVVLDIAAVGVGAATASSRGVFALARDRRIPAYFAKVSASHGGPVGAIAFVSGWSLFVVLWEWFGPGIAPLDGYFPMFAWLSTFGGFSLTVVYFLMCLGALRGLQDIGGKAIVASVVGMLVSGGAVFGGIYRQGHPFDKIWMTAAVWVILGVVVTSVLHGRRRATEVLADLTD
ncbi:MAG: APC family permease [Actinomycetota bacterium]